MIHFLRRSSLAVFCAALAAAPVSAADVNSGDYLPAPAGTNLLVFYSQYATRDEYVSSSGQNFSNDTGLDSYVNILRYVHYFDIGGFTVAPQVLIPAGTLYNGRFEGTAFDAAAGVADPILATTVWVVNNKATQTYIGIMPYLFLPVGQYSAGQVLNLGENRWKLDLQVGWYQGLTNAVALQLTGDVVWYGDNTQGGNGTQTLSQDPTYQLQAWLSYAFAPTWSAAVGYSQFWGGTEYLAGMPTGNATDRSQVRLELSKFVTPTFQVLGLIQRDVAASGGFPEAFRGTVRLLQVF
ncbi:transporter [Xanthobacter dioxanivorans]|uniref:Transporter n=1 Tax=Xanthobacter dioxanivorans TaxID=2528964 RepID=A0A974SJ72_9HYPH|nr:transporter [Xanthobacter dioxanivorans]QRG06939.1 transporter [Xanthobacter dioxanivorans]